MRRFALLSRIALATACLGACAPGSPQFADSSPIREQGGTSWYWQNGVCIKVMTDGEDDQRFRVAPAECRVE